MFCFFLNVFSCAAFFSSHKSGWVAWLCKHVRVQKLGRARQISVLIILKVISKWRSGHEGYTVLHNIFIISSSYTVSAWERRGNEREGGRFWSRDMCSEIYLREDPHSPIDANTFPGRHKSCSGCRSWSDFVWHRGLLNLQWNHGEEDCLFYIFIYLFFTSHEFITQWGFDNPFHQRNTDIWRFCSMTLLFFFSFCALKLWQGYC